MSEGTTNIKNTTKGAEMKSDNKTHTQAQTHTVTAEKEVVQKAHRKDEEDQAIREKPVLLYFNELR